MSKPHMRKLAAFSQLLRNEEGYGAVPDFDPWDGGARAGALFLMEKPGPKAFRSGFVSRNNDDGTAQNMFHFMQAAEIPREQTCIWNVVPGWNGTTKLTAPELRRGGEALSTLLGLLPNLKIVVLVGGRAREAWERSAQTANLSGLPTISSAHPSPVNRAFNRAEWEAIPDQWSGARPYLKGQ